MLTNDVVSDLKIHDIFKLLSTSVFNCSTSGKASNLKFDGNIYVIKFYYFHILLSKVKLKTKLLQLKNSLR